ncbi:MAG: TonB-dependent receptor [Thermoanaerobaculales bacterium]|nr:TonB-dependent receptor [Thermoanaerobaculales bacterium]
MSQSYLTVWLLLIPLFLVAELSSARESELDLSEMTFEELLAVKISSASRTEMSVRDLPVTVHVISRDEILRNNYTSLVDALKHIPGIKTSQPCIANFGDAFLVRGFLGNYYMKILINGLPIQPSVAGAMPIGEQINIKSAERIEVILGPTASLYGADALMGVINIVTLTPERSYSRVDATVGQLGYLNTTLFSSFTIGEADRGLRINIHALYGKRDDQDVKDNYSDLYDPQRYGGQTSAVELGDLPSRNKSFGLQLLYRGFDFSYDYMYRRNHSSVGLNTYYYDFDDPDAFWGETIERSVLKHKGTHRDVDFHTSLSYLKYRLDPHTYYAFSYGDLDAYKYEASDDILFEEVAVWRPSRTLEIVGGVSYQFSEALPKTNDLEEPFDEAYYEPFRLDQPPAHPVFGDFGFNPLRYNNWAVFLQGTTSSDGFTVIVGARYDDHSEYGSSFSPRLAFKSDLSERTSVRASYAKAYRAPSPFYSYNSIAVPRTMDDGSIKINYFSIPNPDLAPENFYAFESALRTVFSPRVSVEFIGFHYEIRGLISAHSLPVDPELYPNSYNPEGDRAGIFVNDGESILYGFELWASFRDVMPSLNSGADFSVCYTKGKETLPGDGGKIGNFRQSPRWLGKLRLHSRPTEKLTVGLDAVYSSSWYSREISDVEEYEDPTNKNEGYLVVDANSRFQIGDSFWLSLRINNIFDEAFGGIEAFGSQTELDYHPQLGRSIYLGVEYGFEW